MAIDSQLWDRYHEWKRLTECEGMAILTSDWPEVRRCQTAKQHLQPEIIRLTDLAKKEIASTSARHNFEHRIREVVNELILLESRNSTHLKERIAHTERERSQLDLTSQRLRQVHQSYVPKAAPSWDQYS